MPVTYEWKVELIDEHGDIADALHFSDDELRDALEAFIKNAPDYNAAEIVLVRDVWDDIDGITDRQHAYLMNGTLPDAFEYGAKIPARLRGIVDQAFIAN